MSKVAAAFFACAVITASVFLQAAAEQQPLILWNRNFDTAPVDKILILALKKTEDLYPPLSVVASTPLEQHEALALLNKASNLPGGQLDVLSAAAEASREDSLLTVRFPVLKGLLGYRVCLIRKTAQKDFTNINTAFEFQQRKLQICQGTHWPDTPILQRNGFEVITAEKYQGLYDLLRTRECDCFLRGVQEIVPELNAYSSEFAIEKTLLFRYVQPGFFYINKHRSQLLLRIELGLLRALSDGSYERLFQQIMGKQLVSLRLQDRIVFQLNNPDKSAVVEHLSGMKELWFPE